MKRNRHDKIIELILSKNIYTQEDLINELSASGYVVTQATISRDIKELKLVKEMDENGVYRYVTGNNKGMGDTAGKFSRIFFESVINVDYAQNIVSIKCRDGMANAACATLDEANQQGVVGTLAGDDTIFVLMRTTADAADFTKEIYKYISG